MSYIPGPPVLDSSLQALQDFALAVIDEIPSIAAGPLDHAGYPIYT